MKREFWFVVGSQFLYGPEVLETVEARAREMAAELTKALPYPLVYKVTAKTNKEISDVVSPGATPSRPARCGSTACAICRSLGATLRPSTTQRSPTMRSTWTS